MSTILTSHVICSYSSDPLLGVGSNLLKVSAIGLVLGALASKIRVRANLDFFSQSELEELRTHRSPTQHYHKHHFNSRFPIEIKILCTVGNVSGEN